MDVHIHICTVLLSGNLHQRLQILMFSVLSLRDVTCRLCWFGCIA